MSQDTTKMYHIVSYVFDSHNLLNHIKADWMSVYDLTFIEVSAGFWCYQLPLTPSGNDSLMGGNGRVLCTLGILGQDTLIARVQKYDRDAQQLCAVLEKESLGRTIEEETSQHTSDTIAKSEKAATTRPQSPNITKPRPPRVPEPFAIHETVHIIPLNYTFFF